MMRAIFLTACGCALGATLACADAKPKDPAALEAARVADSARLVGTAADVDVPKLMQRCAICHSVNGAGTTTIFPPLAKADWVTGDPDRLIALMLRGVRGPITVNGVVFTNQMMPYGDGNEMTDHQLAALLTTLRTSWGNSAAAISADDVTRVRAKTATRTTPYTAAELDSLR